MENDATNQSGKHPMFEIRDASHLEHARESWDRIVEADSYAWFYQTFDTYRLALSSATAHNPIDCSFFLLRDGHPVAVAPLIIENMPIGDRAFLQGVYSPGVPFIPYPAFAGDAIRDDAEEFTCAEIFARAHNAGAGRIVMRLIPPLNTDEDMSKRIERIAERFDAIVSPLPHHLATVSKEMLGTIRSRYDYKHFSPRFDCTIADGEEVTQELVATYAALHAKDAGREVRSLESYGLQARMAERGAGFYVIVKNKADGSIGGMALIYTVKGAAYYASVAVDPACQKQCIGYLLQARAVEELLVRGIRFYDLGQKTGAPTFVEPGSSKLQGISHFKNKFSGNGSYTTYQLEKYFTRECLHAAMEEKERALAAYIQP